MAPAESTPLSSHMLALLLLLLICLASRIALLLLAAWLSSAQASAPHHTRTLITFSAFVPQSPFDLLCKWSYHIQYASHTVPRVPSQEAADG
jgi:hypothetical protein